MGCGVGVALSGRRPQTATWLLGRSIREVLEADPGQLGARSAARGRPCGRWPGSLRRARGAAPARPVSVSSFLGPVARRASARGSMQPPGSRARAAGRPGQWKAVPGRGRAAAENPSLGIAWSLTQGEGAPAFPGGCGTVKPVEVSLRPPVPRASLYGEDPGPGGRRGDRICVCRALSSARSGRARLSCVSRCVARSPDTRQDIILSFQVLTQTFPPGTAGVSVVACPAAARLCLVSPALCKQRDF